jgi:catechol 2,3-dioxygenase-like lactoylglutathione lyase family enzyme
VSRVQLALNVTDLNAAVRFYAHLFATEPAKVRPGYANFAIADPPLKLVLIEGPSAGGTLNHLGVEVSSAPEVTAAQRRLAGAGLTTAVEDEVACCYAVQDKVWVAGADAEPWEIYTVLANVEMPAGLRVAGAGAADISDTGACCATTPAVAASAGGEVRAGDPYADRGGAGACCAAAPAIETSASCDAAACA